MTLQEMLAKALSEEFPWLKDPKGTAFDTAAGGILKKMGHRSSKTETEFGKQVCRAVFDVPEEKEETP